MMKPTDFHDLMNQCKNNVFNQNFPLNSKTLLAGAYGIICFPSVLGIFQCFFWKKRHIAAHLKLASVYGFFTVGISFFTSHLIVEIVKLKQKKFPLSYIDDKNIALCTVLSLTQFFIIAKSFKVVLPSNLLYPGAFAKKGIHLQQSQFLKPVTQSQRNKIQMIGYRYGCHTCGKKYLKFFNTIKQLFVTSHIKVEYVADHQPPKAISLENLKKNNGFLFPHCFNCSSKQAFQVRLAKEKPMLIENRIITHVMRFKLWKLFIPWTLFFSFYDVEIAMNSILHCFI